MITAACYLWLLVRQKNESWWDQKLIWVQSLVQMQQVVVRGLTCGHTACHQWHITVIVKADLFKYLYPYIVGSIPKTLKLLKNKSFQHVAALICW